MAVYYVNTNLPDEVVQVLLSEKELCEVSDDSSRNQTLKVI